MTLLHKTVLGSLTMWIPFIPSLHHSLWEIKVCFGWTRKKIDLKTNFKSLPWPRTSCGWLSCILRGMQRGKEGGMTGKKQNTMSTVMLLHCHVTYISMKTTSKVMNSTCSLWSPSSLNGRLHIMIQVKYIILSYHCIISLSSYYMYVWYSKEEHTQRLRQNVTCCIDFYVSMWAYYSEKSH